MSNPIRLLKSIKQYNRSLYGSVIFYLLSSGACAIGAISNGNHSGKVALDNSKNVLFEQFSDNTFSLELLKNKSQFDFQTLVFGGMIETDLQSWHGNNIITTSSEVYQTGHGLYLTQATLDAMANLTNWSMLFLSYSGQQLGEGGDNGNYFYWPRAFILFGNLDCFPIYATAGISTLPFGVFTGSETWGTPLTSDYFDPQQAPQFIASFYKNNLNVSAGAYRDEINYENHAISTLIYNNTIGNFSYSAGLGYIGKLKTNSTGTRSTFHARKSSATSENMGGVWDVNASVGYQLLSLSAEYLIGSKKVAKNSNKPEAYSLAISLDPTIYGRATTFGISYSVSLNLNNIPTTLPGQNAVLLASSGLKNDWAASVSRAIFTDNIVLGLNAERDLAYTDLHTYTYTVDVSAYL